MIFTKGSIYEAVRASIAIPSVLTPVKTENSILVDGGVIDNVPISHVKRTKDDIFIVVHVNADIPVYRPSISKKEKDRKHSVYLEKIKGFQSHLNKIKPKSKHEKMGYFDILINISRDSCGVFNFYKAEELVEIGRHAAIQSLKAYEKID